MTRAQMLTSLKAQIGPGIQVQDTDLNTWLNDYYLYLCDEISSVNTDYFTKSSYTSVFAGQQEYSLPAEYERMAMVNVQYAGVWQRAQPLQAGINQIPTHENTGSAQGYIESDPRYYLYGNDPAILGLMPIPTTTTVSGLKIWYVYTPDSFDSDASTPVFPEKYHSLIVKGAYADFLDQNDEHGAADNVRTRLDGRIEKMLSNLSMQQVDEPKSVVITSNYDLYIDQGFV